MGIIQDKAHLIAADMEKSQVEHRVAFDPLIIATIIEIIYYLIEIYKDCKQTPQQAAVSMRSGGVLERFRLRRAIRKHIDDPDMHDHIGQRMFGSTLSVAKQVQDDEVSQMYNEVNTTSLKR